MLSNLKLLPDDPILGLADSFKKDIRSPKYDLTIGLFYNDKGIVPMMESVMIAEKEIYRKSLNKNYLPIIGTDKYIH